MNNIFLVLLLLFLSSHKVIAQTLPQPPTNLRVGSETASSNWSERFGGTNSDRALAVAVGSSGNIFVTGYSIKPSPLGGTTTTSDLFIAMVSPAGALQWVKTFGGTDATIVPVAISLDQSGNIVVAGNLYGGGDLGQGVLRSAGKSDVFLAKYTPSDGSPQFTKRFGGTGDDTVTSMTVDKNNGEILLAGIFNATSDFSAGTGTALTTKWAGDPDCFLAKYSLNGVHQWSKNWANIGRDVISSLAVDNSGNILFAGSTDSYINFGGRDFSGTGGGSLLLVKLNGGGTHQWSESYASASPKSVTLDESGNLLVTGLLAGTTSIGGSTVSSAGSWDIFIAKYSTSNGAHLWSRSMGGMTEDYASSIAVSSDGNILLFGYFNYTSSLGGPALTSAGLYDMVVAKYSSTGAYISAQTFGGTGNDLSSSMVVDASGAIIATGFFQGTATFAGESLTSAGGDDGVVFRYKF